MVESKEMQYPTPMYAVFGLKDDLSQFPGKSATEVVQDLKQKGVNAVFGGYENPALRNELRKAGIKVYAEIGIFAGANYWKTHPESRPVTSLGKPMEKEDWYGGVCPNQEWLRKQKLDEIKKLCTQSQVDGIWLDFIRYPCHWEVKEPKLIQTCFCPRCLGLFQKQTHITIPATLKSTKTKADWILTQHKQEWTAWKCSVITGYVQECNQLIKKQNPKIVVGLFGVPWNKTEYHNAIAEIIAQDYVALSKYIDIFSPMVYHKLCYRNVPWIHTAAENIHQLTQKPVVPIVQACSIPDKIDNTEFIQTVQTGLESPSSGVILFTLDYALKENKYILLDDLFDKELK